MATTREAGRHCDENEAAGGGHTRLLGV